MNSFVKYVDPFIGVDDPGRCLVGPYLPNGIVRLGPDTTYPQQSNGYDSCNPIIHFSHTHVSGTGGGGRYGNISIMPFTGIPRFTLDPSGKMDEIAAPGYYGVTLVPSNITAELTCTHRTGVHRYTFPEGVNTNILLDVGSTIQVGDQVPGEDTGISTGGFVEFISDTEIVGKGDYRGGWGHKFPYSVYFYFKSDIPFQRTLVVNNNGIMPGIVCDGPNCKAVIGFGERKTVEIKVGISYVSIANARAGVENEGKNKNFDTLKTEAAETWERLLSKIRVEGGTEEEKKLFYTLFTRLMCMPSDLGIDDENPLWKSGVRHFTDYYALWDSVRNANSLISLFDPELEVDMLNCLLDIAEHTGWLPDAWIAGHSAMIQGGSSADVLICEAALKDFKGIDYEKALKKMRKNNEVLSPDPWLYGRHLKEYKELGYLSTNIKKNCVSRHMEYTYQDWCIATLAHELGEDGIAEIYYESSKKIWNLWREDIKFFSPKHSNGQWVTPFHPDKCLPDCWNDPYFYEGTSWQWSFSVFQDFQGLIDRHGSKEAFVKHLDRFFDNNYFYLKETMLHIPYLYIYGGRPDKTADRVKEYREKGYKPTRNGLMDNEDMGCQSAWYMCSSMGLYPVMGQDIYLLTTPAFKNINIVLGKSGKILNIKAADAGTGKEYIVSATLNGKSLNRAWIRHEEIKDGAEICFILGNEPTAWGIDELPPSNWKR
jgi:predicted alpha-1,2-mannosidase